MNDMSNFFPGKIFTFQNRSRWILILEKFRENLYNDTFQC